MVMFNCVPVNRVDIHGRNGVVHVLSKPMHPAYTHSLNDLIAQDPDLSMFLTLIGYADLLDWIRVSGPLTVFAPTNDALNRLPIRFLDSITYDVKYFDALQALVKNHLVDGFVCSLGLRIQVDLKTLEGEALPLSCDDSYTLNVGPAILTTQDLIAKNGVLHHIDRVLVPPKALSLIQICRRAGATKFIELVRLAKMFDELVSFGPYTMFAPSNEALNGINSSILNDRTSVTQLVLYHLVDGTHASYTLRDNQPIVTLMQNASLRVKVGRKVMTVEDGIVVSKDNLAFNGYVHVIDRVLTPPTISIARVLAVNSTFSRFTALITELGTDVWSELSRGPGPLTLLVVPNQDMDTWASDLFTYYRIINDKTLLTQSLNIHILDDFIMPRGLLNGSHTLLRSRHKPHRPLQLTMQRGFLSLRHTSISNDYLLTTNGIILFCDSLILA
ncbi:unnamed protein product [Meganyctiphanes norvegica]|uniref:FAS1 domain-containing protein n=1 Tax=Meganyctiphanes norvegica TaxID=48144 RepID=A0AAV2QF96_MEGNR